MDTFRYFCRQHHLIYLYTSFCLVLLASCQPLTLLPARVDVKVSVANFATAHRLCSGGFVTHNLDHMTMVPGGDTVRMFEANGGGVAINDLDDDGWLDIVLANHRDPNTILWNRGADTANPLRFETERIGKGDARAATIVDIDGDDRLDIVFSRRVSAPNYWRNVGNRRFVPEVLDGVSKPLYAINWGDLDQDGDLDLVGGTYDAGLLAEFGQDFLNGTDAGVYIYTQTDGGFRGEPLALNAQALALVLVDLNDDQRLDILVGNDFGVRDYGWLQMDAAGEEKAGLEWKPLELTVMSHSTMSYASGDTNNDGQFEIFSTDMMPYADDPETKAAWEPLMASMMDENHDAEDDPQIMANVMRHSSPEASAGLASTNLASADLASTDLAEALGVNATGWSWSGKFGDLNQDGLLDLYVVNGMIEATTFAHLPDHELREENQAFRNALDNQGGTRFHPAPEWSLNSTESGRGMSMADLDNDGDLDIVVNNLRGPAQLFENQLCEGSSLLVELRWPESGNTRGVGSLLTLRTTDGVYQRRVEAASGYLSGDAAQIHFGIADGVRVVGLEVLWPDGGLSVVKGVAVNQRLELLR